MRHLAPRITIDAAVRSGRPVIEGTRVPVELVIAKLATGMTAADICQQYDLLPADILAALHYAALVLSEEEVRAVG